MNITIIYTQFIELNILNNIEQYIFVYQILSIETGTNTDINNYQNFVFKIEDKIILKTIFLNLTTCVFFVSTMYFG